VNSYKQPAGQDRYPVAIGSALGNVKAEKDTTDVSYFLGKKFYSIGELHKIKGIPLRTIDAHGNDVQLVSRELYETVFQSGTVVVSFNTLKKSLFSAKASISTHIMSRTVRPSGVYTLYE
jgi:hypothetical protein